MAEWGRGLIYTIGHIQSYDKGIKEYGEEFLKLGPKDSYKGQYYAGGAAFEMAEDALQFLMDGNYLGNHAVYSLDGDWDKDTYEFSIFESFRRINKDLRIIEKIKIGPRYAQT